MNSKWFWLFRLEWPVPVYLLAVWRGRAASIRCNILWKYRFCSSFAWCVSIVCRYTALDFSVEMHLFIWSCFMYEVCLSFNYIIWLSQPVYTTTYTTLGKGTLSHPCCTSFERWFFPRPKHAGLFSLQLSGSGILSHLIFAHIGNWFNFESMIHMHPLCLSYIAGAFYIVHVCVLIRIVPVCCGNIWEYKSKNDKEADDIVGSEFCVAVSFRHTKCARRRFALLFHVTRLAALWIRCTKLCGFSAVATFMISNRTTSAHRQLWQRYNERQSR